MTHVTTTLTRAERLISQHNRTETPQNHSPSVELPWAIPLKPRGLGVDFFPKEERVETTTCQSDKLITINKTTTSKYFWNLP